MKVVNQSFPVGNIKLSVVIIFGGQSVEHEVSVLSAKNVINAIDRNRFNVSAIFVDKLGEWFLLDDLSKLDEATISTIPGFKDLSLRVAVSPGSGPKSFINRDSGGVCCEVDVVFPLIHGRGGEDGNLQGLLFCADLPFVGPDNYGSSIAMDKDLTKIILSASGVLIGKYISLRSHEINLLNLETVIKNLGLPLFVKSAKQGSSVSVSKAKTIDSLKFAIETASKFGNKILIEECIVGREIECSVMGNEDEVIASLPGEVIISGDEFYSYDAKYVSNTAAKTVVPADLSESQVSLVQEVSVKAYKSINCEGMARVDMFLTDSGSVYINEINTIPGFTSISMYPQMWQASGISYSELVTRLIMLAVERDKRERSYTRVL